MTANAGGPGGELQLLGAGVAKIPAHRVRSLIIWHAALCVLTGICFVVTCVAFASALTQVGKVSKLSGEDDITPLLAYSS